MTYGLRVPPGETTEAAPYEGTGQFITLGEALVCIAPTGPVAFEAARDYRAHPGGAELNTCVAMRRLGFATVFFTRLGDDGPGRLLAQAMGALGIAVSTETDPDCPTGLYLREWLPDGARRLAYYRRDSAATQLGANPLPLPSMTAADLVLVTGITIALGPGPRRACEQVVAAAHEAGARVCFDPNYRPLLWDSESAARTALLEVMRSVNVLLLSEDDAALLYGSTDPGVVLDAALSQGPGVVVFKQGERGVSVATGDGTRFDQAAADVTEALDPVGAGDGFNGGFLAGLLSGLDLHHATQLAAYVGARAVEAIGDNAGYPHLADLPDELRTLLGTRRSAPSQHSNQRGEHVAL